MEAPRLNGMHDNKNIANQAHLLLFSFGSPITHPRSIFLCPRLCCMHARRSFCFIFASFLVFVRQIKPLKVKETKAKKVDKKTRKKRKPAF